LRVVEYIQSKWSFRPETARQLAKEAFKKWRSSVVPELPVTLGELSMEQRIEDCEKKLENHEARLRRLEEKP